LFGPSWFWSLFLFFLLAARASAEPCQESPEVGAGGLYTFVWENDFFNGPELNFDENYTNGNRLSYSSSPRDLEGTHGQIARSLLGADCESEVRYSLAFGQRIYTPGDKAATSPLPKEHPYGGWLYGEYAVQVARRNSMFAGSGGEEGHPRDLETLSLGLGFVGPIAQGERTQNNFHRLIGDDPALGWDNQIGNEPGLLVSYDRRWRQGALALSEQSKAGFDLIPGFGFSFGNIAVHANAGLWVRLSSDLGSSEPLPRLGTAGPGLFKTAPVGWYLFAGLEGRAIARSIFLDGNTFRDSPSVEKYSFVTDRQVGAAIRIYRFQFSYTHITSTEEFRTQARPHRFGSANIALRF
jgi:lipid A 3-O-deacylase